LRFVDMTWWIVRYFSTQNIDFCFSLQKIKARLRLLDALITKQQGNSTI
jgi:hypothetical protein